MARPGPLALVGSGEYLPQMADVEAGLLAGRPPRYVQLATAAVPDGPDVVERWHSLGITQAERLGVEPVIVPVNDRADAETRKWPPRWPGRGWCTCRVVTRRTWPTPCEIPRCGPRSSMRGAVAPPWPGVALAPSRSTSWVPRLRNPSEEGAIGLGLLPHLRVIPHFDRFAARGTYILNRFLLPFDPAVTVVGVDEETALVGGPEEWTVQGRQSVWRLTPDGRERWGVGATLRTTMTAGA